MRRCPTWLPQVDLASPPLEDANAAPARNLRLELEWRHPLPVELHKRRHPSQKATQTLSQFLGNTDRFRGIRQSDRVYDCSCLTAAEIVRENRWLPHKSHPVPKTPSALMRRQNRLSSRHDGSAVFTPGSSGFAVQAEGPPCKCRAPTSVDGFAGEIGVPGNTSMMRSVVLATFLVIAAISFFALLHRSSKWDFPGERRFGGSGAPADGVQVYIEPITVNAVADSMQLRVTVASNKTSDDSRPSTSDHDFTLLLGHDNTVERIEIHANRPAPITTIDLDLSDGDVNSYPLDAYRAGLWVRCVAAPAVVNAEPILMPLQVIVWERILGFRLQTDELPGSAAGGSNLAIRIHRSFAVIVFVFAAYTAMAILAFGALTIGTLVFLGIRRPETTLLGALAGIVFALPALRNALPGAPPLGVLGDIFVFLWAELASVLAIALMIVTWARAGPRP
jgi:Domain of unknown function (DUF4436)